MTATGGTPVIHEDDNLLVLENGDLAPRNPKGLRMTFAWRGRPCEATLSRDGLFLSARLGRIPSTATNPAARARLIDAVRNGALPIPQGHRLHLDKQHALHVLDRSLTRIPTNMVAILSAFVRFCLKIDPLLDRLEDMQPHGTAT